jgi:hypothetical protein
VFQNSWTSITDAEHSGNPSISTGQEPRLSTANVREAMLKINIVKLK